jgi:hypothetical protein
MIKRSIDYRKENEEEVNLAEKLEVTCNCTKSNCQKKYCECYKAGEGCKDSCRCINCSNNKEIKPAIKKKAPKFAPANYTIESISIFIHNTDFIMNISKNVPKSGKKVSKIFQVNNIKPIETPKLLKKRNRNFKTEETQKSKSTNITSTPLFTTCNNQQKTKKMSIEDDNLIKNLDKLY